MKELKDFRISIGLTISEMSEKIGISKSFYEKIETGIRIPSANFIKKLKIQFPQFDANIFFDVSHH